ncbi:phosphoglucosamine mutase [Helicobacter cetorum]|uniref:Phosphoglucosamine mutase n=1 Tax=Helicobacter cetorum (strain ATCC BAA-429 / MIT 00-7128) TaxID=182217 RepID=I0ELF9_HELC0|nr:phosphoglucosamine mutase [Helicobacter cetorum]AFI03778.1 phosphoglucosamine mutase [Helicobacter cetorum MIT 00-7128]
MKIFGTDGVRGKAGAYLTPMFIMRLGIAAGLYFRKTSRTNKILIGKDTRKSGYMIENALVSALTSIGYNVIQIGPMPTPAIAFLTENMRCDAGIMISASHNPFEDNGIKFFNSFGYKLTQDDEKAIEEIFQNEELLHSSYKVGENIGNAKRIDDVIGRYIVHLKHSFPKHLDLQGMRIVLDTANGAAYKVAPVVFSELGADVVIINDKPNGCNINHQCGALYPTQLGEEVRKYRADLGFALDGDADRLVVVDNLGNIVHGDKLIGVLGAYQKSKNALSSKVIVATNMSNLALKEYLHTKDLELKYCAIGDKFVSECMRLNNANFGGEQSGHIIFSDYAKTGDGLVSALQVSALVLESKKPSSTTLNPFELYPQSLVNLSVQKKPTLESLKGYNNLIKELEKLQIRHLIRYSGTENKLRILLEGKDEKTLETKMQELKEFFEGQLC